MQLGEMEFDPATGRVESPEGRVDLTPRETALLTCLMEAHGDAVSREELLEQAWGWQHASDVKTKTVDVHVGRLRDKLELAGIDPYTVQTVRYLGYRIQDPQDGAKPTPAAGK